MEKIQFDNGMQSFRLGQGILRFNPGDPNLYARFSEAAQKLENLEKELVAKAAEQDPVALLGEADREMKKLLNWVFGLGNDFDEVLQGVNLLAVTASGSRVADNLFAALQPILTEGARRCAQEQADAALARAKARRNAQ